MAAVRRRGTSVPATGPEAGERTVCCRAFKALASLLLDLLVVDVLLQLISLLSTL